MRKRIFAGIAFSVLLFLAGCTTAEAAALKVGVRDDIVNFGYFNPDTEQYYGLEIDLAAKIAKEAGYSDVEYVTVDPDNREEKLESGEVDCILAAYSITDERKEKFDFSPAYYEDVSGIIVEKTSLIETMEDLVGKKIGGLNGTNTEDELKARMTEAGLIIDTDSEGTEFQFDDSYEALIEELEVGSLDAVCMDGCISHTYMNEDRMVLKEVIGEQQYGVATVKGSELSGKIGKAVQKLLDDGTVDELKDKWD